jgi:hypothetical protein
VVANIPCIGKADAHIYIYIYHIVSYIYIYIRCCFSNEWVDTDTHVQTYSQDIDHKSLTMNRSKHDRFTFKHAHMLMHRQAEVSSCNICTCLFQGSNLSVLWLAS